LVSHKLLLFHAQNLWTHIHISSYQTNHGSSSGNEKTDHSPLTTSSGKNLYLCLFKCVYLYRDSSMDF
jgi:hypothetical protein